MNCKPGDLAYIVHGGNLTGRVVQVLYYAPIGVSFVLPDGITQNAQSYEWVCFFPSEVDAPMSLGSTRPTHYACVPDSKLRPIGGVPVHDEEQMEVPA